MLKIAVLGGTGGMGSLFSEFWKKVGFEVNTFGSDLNELEKFSQCDVVVFATPKDKFEEILTKIKTALEAGQMANRLEFSEDDQKIVKGLNLMTTKPILYALNKKTGGDNLDDKNDDRYTKLIDYFQENSFTYVKVDAILN